MDLHDLIVSNPDLLGGEPCFRGTRVPVATLFDNLADGVGLEEILAAPGDTVKVAGLTAETPDGSETAP